MSNDPKQIDDPNRPDDPQPPRPAAQIEEAGGIGRAIEDVELGAHSSFLRPLRPALWVLIASLVAALLVGRYVQPTWMLHTTNLQVNKDDSGNLVYTYKDKPTPIGIVVPADKAQLTEANVATLAKHGDPLPVFAEVVATPQRVDDVTTMTYSRVTAERHYGFWSLLPAAVAILMCLLTREPLTALLTGTVVGAFILRRYDLTDLVLMPVLTSKSAAEVMLLYLGLLGGLMGIWSKTGAGQAFAQMMTRLFVRGPKTARLVGWLLGIVFFQGGTVSTVIVGTTVKPVADKEKISHEELSYIVDSTASPIAAVIAFNAWPAYVQAFLFVPGVAFLATEADRLSFFFRSIPLSFYGMFAVLGTFLLCIDKAPFLGSRFRKAIRRARETGQLDEPGATPLSAKELEASDVPPGYTPSVFDFVLPLVLLIGIAVGTFIAFGSPNVRWAFGAALLLAAIMAMARGMSLGDLIEGFGNGLKGVVVAAIILVLAIAIGTISRDAGGGRYLVDLLGGNVPYWLLPVALQLMTMVIAFSTGTSWGTYAVAFPLAMPLAWVIATGGPEPLAHPELYMMVCFATVLNGSIYGDQCSPISDTTILSSMTTGTDLMDHVKTQIVPATAAAIMAGICWTIVVVVFAA